MTGGGDTLAHSDDETWRLDFDYRYHLLQLIFHQDTGIDVSFQNRVIDRLPSYYIEMLNIIATAPG